MQLPVAGFDSPYFPDPVVGPSVTHVNGVLGLDFPSRSGAGWVRVGFDRCDAHRVSRGEYPPYPSEHSAVELMPLSVVRQSPWLAERYEYELAHYQDRYGFGGDVDEMVSEFEHFVFWFHDEFVEVIAAGVHFEIQRTLLGHGVFETRPSWSRLGDDLPVEQLGPPDFPVYLRESNKDPRSLIENSTLAERVYLQVDVQPEATGAPFLNLAVRTRDGVTTSRLRKTGDRVIAEFSDLPEESELWPRINDEIDALTERRGRIARSRSD